jgi:hypothetical protein
MERMRSKDGWGLGSGGMIWDAGTRNQRESKGWVLEGESIYPGGCNNEH